METSGILKRWKKILKECLLWLYPNNIYCISCGDFITEGKAYSLCDACMKRLHWITGHRCATCGKELTETQTLCYDCENTVRSFDLGMSCVQYGRMEKELVHRFKYQDRGYMGHFLGQLMAERLMAEEGLAEALDYVIAVPMYKKKEGVRGYNQAEILAKEIAGQLSLPYYKDCLCRNRSTKPMNSLGAEERRENVQNAFSFSEKYKESTKNGVALLVDDVYTTGSTADACAEVLKQNGVQKVVVLAFSSGADRQRKQEI